MKRKDIYRAHRRAFANQRYAGATQTHNYEFNDPHFHLTNNVQEGPNIRDFLNMMGSKAGRVVLFGIPLQQQWSRATPVLNSAAASITRQFCQEKSLIRGLGSKEESLAFWGARGLWSTDRRD
jgi:hypothetical protein